MQNEALLFCCYCSGRDGGCGENGVDMLFSALCTAYNGELPSPTSLTKTGYTGFLLVSDINRRKVVTSSENSEGVTPSLRSNSILYRYIRC